ncbi:glycoside hydrolase family 3 N-terminal domain-containing protein [Pedobacter heparinus]|uniref:Glycoside hydrolase family 3 domain protein n=1 Tax=Pedobacter heparinus (strain ATCC 13125 / DSM 2366 / CIP 104194 / JCM 7457 / NBRC 12017 / NCIMB 9290 / NRRL B-14731 / HIM 762-3) TaxID=485917 RepID=C6XWK6_PEDHD|nr:glycoside hydrolase family 3 N-terminal domain-containing protein [Pedobacter heparinus]ACU06295.1 glycoside hydrolase family 3 domain protein [Pedobacter heparinus DSM 2366]
MRLFQFILFFFTGLQLLKVQAQEKTGYIPLTKQERQKVELLLSKMTLEEKAHQLASFYPNANKRLNIPHMQAGECLHGVVAAGTTSFPQAISIASSWDPSLVERVSTVIAKEARALGIHHCYTPMLGVLRDARWGRFEEGYGEDAYLVSKIGVAFINGLQGRGKNRFDKDHVVATAKHFVADSEPLLGANGAAVEISLRSLHEVHLPPFRAAVEEAQVGSVMPAHHTLNGVPCHINTYTLNDVFRKEYGFDGLVVSDNNDLRWVQERLFATESQEETIRKALEAGVHTELAFKQTWADKRMYGPPLVAAVKNGKVPVKLLDDAVRKVLEFKIALHLDEEENPLGKEMTELQKGTKDADVNADVFFSQIDGSLSSPRSNYKTVLNNPVHDALALEAARKSLILLKNNNLLPFKKSQFKKIAVIGPNADTIRLGTYSTQQPKHFITVKQGIETAVGKNAQVLYAKGTDIQHPKDTQLAEAVAIAKEADVCILVLGDDDKTVMENVDRDDITLPGDQDKLMQAIVATGKPVVLVLLHGRPAAIQWAKDHVPAILDGWFLGQETGTAIAEAIFGDLNPSGKLTVTYPRNVGQVPAFYNTLIPGRPRMMWGTTEGATYPFGYGISYTQFKYGVPKLSKASMKASETVFAEIEVTNTGKVAGDEIVQLYLRDDISSLARPIKELKGFKRISLRPGETQKISLPISSRSLEFWKDGKWITEPGSFTVMMGPNSEELKTIKLELTQ